MNDPAHRRMPGRQARSQDVKDEIHARATSNALTFFFRGAVLGALTTAVLSRTSAWFGRRPRVFKTIFMLAFPIVGFSVGGEHEALRLEREIAYERSYVKVAGLLGGQRDETVPAPVHVDDLGPLVTVDSVKAYVMENQFKLLFSLWGSLVASTLIFT